MSALEELNFRRAERRRDQIRDAVLPKLHSKRGALMPGGSAAMMYLSARGGIGRGEIDDNGIRRGGIDGSGTGRKGVSIVSKQSDAEASCTWSGWIAHI